ncbi:hypothetical protein HHK36_020777 [Tetracentron sinense]|uniref:Alanyl-transfer RNA synthetases family profile domain-containing protein n=1 Tax=Tetracentron sinense TaxID=13715 RepID=A0A834YUL7_TETSI|nr:hypothetical protein HHK36_020777 [Tetracentron sinense]
MDLSATKLAYFDDMWKLQSKATLLSCFQGDDGRRALILDSTIFYPQGGGQPSDTGSITIAESDLRFIVEDVRLKDGIVFHYGFLENSGAECYSKLEKGQEVCLCVEEPRRNLNSRLHSAGHLLDACMRNVGLDSLEPSKGYHFPVGYKAIFVYLGLVALASTWRLSKSSFLRPFVEYKGTVAQNELQSKQMELELEANALISRGGRVSAAVIPYEEAAELCGGCLPDYIPKSSTPRIVKLGSSPGCPCGGTHVADISEIRSLKISQIRTKKGVTKVFYGVGS